MPVNTQELRRRIRATRSIKQITKAMEMIAASKMRKAQFAALASRPYADLARGMLGALAGHSATPAEYLQHPLLARKNTGAPRLLLVVTPNRGLCGSLSAQVVAQARMRAGIGEERQYVSVGRKAARALARLGETTIAHFDGFETQPTANETRPIAKLLMDSFIGGSCAAVNVVYADFISTLSYRIRVRQLLPLYADEPDSAQKVRGGSLGEFFFEPSPHEVLDGLLPRLIELMVYQTLLESLASEHSARMVAMQNASKAADDLIDDFTLTYNAARQSAITAELADIIGGRLALAS